MQSSMAAPQRFQILSLDGGGLKGLFTAAYVAEWEEYTSRPVVDAMDLIAGTSVGGIIALGLPRDTIVTVIARSLLCPSPVLGSKAFVWYGC